jgi:hypothetical protein
MKYGIAALALLGFVAPAKAELVCQGPFAVVEVANPNGPPRWGLWQNATNSIMTIPVYPGNSYTVAWPDPKPAYDWVRYLNAQYKIKC